MLECKISEGEPEWRHVQTESKSMGEGPWVRERQSCYLFISERDLTKDAVCLFSFLSAGRAKHEKPQLQQRKCSLNFKKNSVALQLLVVQTTASPWPWCAGWDKIPCEAELRRNITIHPTQMGNVQQECWPSYWSPTSCFVRRSAGKQRWPSRIKWYRLQLVLVVPLDYRVCLSRIGDVSK